MCIAEELNQSSTWWKAQTYSIFLPHSFVLIHFKLLGIGICISALQLAHPTSVNATMEYRVFLLPSCQALSHGSELQF